MNEKETAAKAIEAAIIEKNKKLSEAMYRDKEG
jgi:hypothetical protein